MGQAIGRVASDQMWMDRRQWAMIAAIGYQSRWEKSATLVQFGQRVKRRREELGVSQRTLGEMAGLHRTYVGDIERGKRNPSLINILCLLDALDIEPGRLLDGLP